MKKLFLLGIFLIPFIAQAENNRWGAFSITNDTKQIIHFKTDSQTKKLEPGQTYNIINPRFTRNPMVTEGYTNKILLRPKVDWFKIAETKPINPERSFTMAPRINLKPGNSAKLMVSSILHNKELPKGFEYHKYSTMPQTMQTPISFLQNVTPPSQEVSKETNNQNNFFIKNDTNHNVHLIYKKRINIKPNKKTKIDEIPANKEFKIEVAISDFKGNQSGIGFRKNKVHIFTLKRNNEFKKGITLEISKLLPLKGFDIKKQETQDRTF